MHRFVYMDVRLFSYNRELIIAKRDVHMISMNLIYTRCLHDVHVLSTRCQQKQTRDTDEMRFPCDDGYNMNNMRVRFLCV